MKVTFEQLKAAFNRVLISRGVDSETADACAEMFARTPNPAFILTALIVSLVSFNNWKTAISFLMPNPNV